jgi:hypothetical protein
MYWIIAMLAVVIAGFFIILWWLNRPAINSDETPCIIQMTWQEHDAVIRAGIIFPDRGYVAKSGVFILPLTLEELQEFYSDVMTAAQEHIGRAARRKQVQLNGSALHVGTLAGYLHQQLLKYWELSGKDADSAPVALPPLSTDNAPDGQSLT